MIRSTTSLENIIIIFSFILLLFLMVHDTAKSSTSFPRESSEWNHQLVRVMILPEGRIVKGLIELPYYLASPHISCLRLLEQEKASLKKGFRLTT